MAEPYFSLIVWTHDPDLDHFRNMLESIDDQEYRNFELYILDDAASYTIETNIKEFFPDIVDKVHYRKLKKKSGGAYALNIGSHFAEGDHLVFVGQHDRLSPNTLSDLAQAIEYLEGQDAIIYTDHDELVDQDRMNPHFKCGFNKELLLHTDYIGEFICMNKETYKLLGPFNEKARFAYIYEYLLRASSRNMRIDHIDGLLYHKRQTKRPTNREERMAAQSVQNEYMALAGSYLSKAGVHCQVKAGSDYSSWNVVYSDAEFRRYGGDYMFLHDKNVRLYTRNNARKMYAYLKQPDVAVVGMRFLDHGLTLDNVGFIHDDSGVAYPAFHGQKLFRASYENLANIPRDVAMVDAGCCMIDAKVYRSIGGFDPALKGRDAMLDFCIRAREKGFRTVVIPECLGRYKVKNNESSEASHDALYLKHGQILSGGDEFYNSYLPMGLSNFVLPGTEEEPEVKEEESLDSPQHIG